VKGQLSVMLSLSRDVTLSRINHLNGNPFRPSSASQWLLSEIGAASVFANAGD